MKETFAPTTLYYPESDGKRMADNTKQFDYIVLIKLGLEARFAQSPTVFVAGDLLWYPTEGNNRLCVAPDVMVAFGRPKGYRGSYLQWNEDNIAPQVVFEIVSPSNTFSEMTRKFAFYEQYGVQEYYLYDPFDGEFSGWKRSEDGQKLEPIANIEDWISPFLDTRFVLTDGELEMFLPDGRKVLNYVDLEYEYRAELLRAEKESRRADREERRAARESERAEKEAERAMKETERAEKEAERADAERRAKEDAEQKAERLAAKLRELGVNPEAP